MYPFFRHTLFQFPCNRLKGCQREQIGRKVSQGHIHAAVEQQFSYFNPDHGGSHHHCLLDTALFQRMLHTAGVIHGAHEEYPGSCQPLQRRHHRPGPGGNQDLIKRFPSSIGQQDAPVGQYPAYRLPAVKTDVKLPGDGFQAAKGIRILFFQPA